MTQPFADALTWMPKSRALGATLTRAHDIARAQGHASVLLEHLLQSLVEDPDASAVLLSCQVDLLKLNESVSQHLAAQPVAGADQPVASPGLILILEYAAAAARQSKRNEVNGSIVLAAMTGEGKSDAARMLKAAGLKFEDTISALRKGPPPRPASSDAAPSQPARPASPAPITPPTAATVAPPPPAPPVALTEPAGGGTEDPLTTARRRVAALRTSQPSAALSAAAPPAPVESPVAQIVDEARQPIAVGMNMPPILPPPIAQQQTAGEPQAWAPPPQPINPGSNVRPMRMPPPLPQVATRPPPPPPSSRPTASDARPPVQLRAPWAAPGGEAAEPLDLPAPPAASPVRAGVPGPGIAIPVDATPIDPTHLTNGFPYKVQDKTPATIEVRLNRSAVLATAAAMRVGVHDRRDVALTRAVTLKLRAPNGGFYVETSAPETQWFDSRAASPLDEDVRWRWIVTPQSSGTKPLAIALTMRTIAADGTVIDTSLPEHQVSIRVGSNFRAGMRRLGRAAIAVSLGVTFGFLATGGFATLFGRLLK